MTVIHNEKKIIKGFWLQINQFQIGHQQKCFANHFHGHVCREQKNKTKITKMNTVLIFLKR